MLGRESARTSKEGAAGVGPALYPRELTAGDRSERWLAVPHSGATRPIKDKSKQLFKKPHANFLRTGV